MRSTKSLINRLHDQWCRDNGYKSASLQAIKPQAASIKPQAYKPQAP